MNLKRILFQHSLVGALCLQAAASRFSLQDRWQIVHRGGADQLPSSSFGLDVQQQSSDYPPEYYQDVEPPSPHETVQDNIDSWRAQQRQRAEATQYSARDDQGRMKLLTSVSKGSRILIFFVLMLRDIHLYEVADASRKGLARVFCVTPLIFLFLSNMVGVFASLTNPSHNTKKRLKAILNLDKFLEAALMVFYLFRLTIFPPAHIPREIFIANIFHSTFFILQAQAFTRLSWDETAAPSINSYAPVQQSNLNSRQSPPPSFTQYDNPQEQQLYQPSTLADAPEDSTY